jgi:hypothetical protein
MIRMGRSSRLWVNRLASCVPVARDLRDVWLDGVFSDISHPHAAPTANFEEPSRGLRRVAALIRTSQTEWSQRIEAELIQFRNSKGRSGCRSPYAPAIEKEYCFASGSDYRPKRHTRPLCILRLF